MEEEGEGSGVWGWLLRLRVALVLTFVQLCFSGYAIISQSVLHKSSATGSGSGGHDDGKALNPAVFIVCRDVGCSIVLLVAGRIQAGKFMWPDPQDRFLFVLIGICNVYFGQYFFVMGIKYTDALSGSIWQNTIPIFTLFMGLLSGLEKIDMRPHGMAKLVGIVCSVSGAAVAGVMNSKTGTRENPMLGNIFFGLQCFFGSMFFLLQKSVLNRYPPLQTTAWGYCMGGILMVLVVTPQATEASDWDIDGNEFLAILYVIFISSALGYALYAWANKQVGPTFVVVFGPLQIVFTAILQLLFFHTPISEGSYIGGSLVSVGLFMLVAGRVVEEAEAQKVLERTNQYYRGPAGRWDDMRKSRNAQEARDGLLQ